MINIAKEEINKRLIHFESLKNSMPIYCFVVTNSSEPKQNSEYKLSNTEAYAHLIVV